MIVDNELNKKVATSIIYNPLQFIDESWLSHLEFGKEIAVIDNWRKNARINSWFINEYQLADLSIDILDNSAFKIILFSPYEIQKLFHYIGATLHYKSCKNVVMRESRVALISTLGEDAYHFCINQATMLLTDWPESWCKQIPDPIPQNYFLIEGLIFYIHLLDFNDQKYFELIKYRLPWSLNQYVTAPTKMIKEEQILAFQLIKKIVKRVLPECFHLLK